MNIIEQLGGYGETKKHIDSYWCDGDNKTYLLEKLLEYRRQHNIFEVGDKVVDTKYKDSDVQEVRSIRGNRMEVFHKNKAYYFATFVFSFRYATDEEIKVGCRL